MGSFLNGFLLGMLAFNIAVLALILIGVAIFRTMERRTPRAWDQSDAPVTKGTPQ